MNNKKDLISKFLTILLRHYDDFVKFDVIIGHDGRYHVRIHVSLQILDPNQDINDINPFLKPDLMIQVPRKRVDHKKILKRIKDTFNLSDHQIKLMIIVQPYHTYESQ